MVLADFSFGDDLSFGVTCADFITILEGQDTFNEILFRFGFRFVVGFGELNFTHEFEASLFLEDYVTV